MFIQIIMRYKKWAGRVNTAYFEMLSKKLKFNMS